jgi:hypothetical protein
VNKNEYAACIKITFPNKINTEINFYNLTTGGRKENKRGVEELKVLTVADSHGQEILEALVCLQVHKERGHIQKF